MQESPLRQRLNDEEVNPTDNSCISVNIEGRSMCPVHQVKSTDRSDNNVAPGKCPADNNSDVTANKNSDDKMITEVTEGTSSCTTTNGSGCPAHRSGK